MKAIRLKSLKASHQVSINDTDCVYQEGALSQVWYIKMGHGNGHGKTVSSTSEHMTSMFYSI